MKWLYGVLDLAAIAGPFALSFDKNVHYVAKWKNVFISIFFMMLIFIPLDAVFTYYKIWGFNEQYISGFSIAYLPIEEWLLFPATHFAVVFIHECLNFYFKKDILQNSYKYILIIIALSGILLSILFPSHLYTTIKAGGASVIILLCLLLFKPVWMSRFTLTYLISLIPFLLMNGILTGSFIDEEIVWYNPDHISAIRIGTIPIEDLFYNLLMLVTTISIYEKLNKKTIS